jgi:flagellar biosynthesis protein FlhB
MIVGYYLVGLLAVLHAATVLISAVICTLQQWTLLICYCLEFVPILIKISLINKLGHQTRLFRKVEFDPNRFKSQLTLSIAVLFLYLVIWTSLDMPKCTDDFEIIGLEDEMNPQ